MPLLNLATEVLPQLMRSQLDDRVVGHPLDRPVGAIEGHRHLGRFGEQLREFFLEVVDLPIHGNLEIRCQMGLQTTRPCVPYHR